MLARGMNQRFQTVLQPKNLMNLPIYLKKKKKKKQQQKEDSSLLITPKELQSNHSINEKPIIEQESPFQKHLKESYHSIIPLKIFQTWHTKDLPKHMNDCVEKLKAQNPEFEHHLYDDQDCREFIKKHFHERVLKAFDKIIPGAYKADLWRYCVIYIEGGIYLDIKFHCTHGFKLIALTEEEHFVNDVPAGPLRFPDYHNEGIFNALMVAKPGNEKFKKCIDAIVHHTQIHFYGGSCLHPTGPFLLRRFFTPEERKKIKLRFHGYKTFRTHGIHYKGIKILDVYPQYRSEKFKFAKTSFYGHLWNARKIYR
jgi:mannosyltransferase OCH1-like enzyme